MLGRRPSIGTSGRMGPSSRVFRWPAAPGWPARATPARRGIRNRHPQGIRWQSAGTFALDREAIVRWCMVPAHAGDLPDLNEAIGSLG
jgi:hypothetical protein